MTGLSATAAFKISDKQLQSADTGAAGTYLPAFIVTEEILIWSQVGEKRRSSKALEENNTSQSITPGCCFVLCHCLGPDTSR